MRIRPRGRWAAVAAAGTVGLVLATAGTASAHVTVDASTVAHQGGFATVTLDVPNETDDASTVKLSVQLPQDQVIAFASVQPKPGWTVETTTRRLDEPVSGEDGSIDEVVDTITWTATDGGIGPGEFDQFRISMGRLPTGVDSLILPTVQGYDDGEDVRWIEADAGADHPAPRVTLLAATADDHGDGSAAEPAAGSSGGDGDDDGSSDVLAGVALGGAILALLVAATAIVLGRRRPAS